MRRFRDFLIYFNMFSAGAISFQASLMMNPIITQILYNNVFLFTIPLPFIQYSRYSFQAKRAEIA